MDLESILSSACRRKIIKFLAEKGSTNVMRLIMGVNSKFPQVNSQLGILQQEKIILDERIGRMRQIRLNKENPKTMLLLKALKILNDDGKSYN